LATMALLLIGAAARFLAKLHRGTSTPGA
jgi:hypothetical protein